VFVPLFERNGFITKLDFWIWEQACKLLRQWTDDGLPVIPLSLNISRIDLYYPHLCDHLLALLEKYHLETSLLKLEITESAYIDDPEGLSEVVKAFRAAGFQVLMDDFGSGYSSLSTLKDMPINIMKIDMRFLATLEGSPRAANILTSVIRMAKWLDMPVIAEGVETKAQLDFLHSIGCDMGQGFYFSRPLSAADFEKLFRAESLIAEPAQATAQQAVDFNMLWDYGREVNLLFDGAVGGMAIYEMIRGELKAQRVNDAYYRMTGCTPQEVFTAAGPSLHCLQNEDQSLLLDACNRAVDSGQLETVVVRRNPGEGAPVWLEYKIRHLTTSADYSVLFFLVRDMTVQKEWENVLLPMDEQYQRIFFSEALFVFGIQPGAHRLDLIYQAENAEELFFPYLYYCKLDKGYCHPQDLPQVKAALSHKHFQRLYETQKQEYKMQTRIKNRQEVWVWVELTLHLLKSPDAASPRFVISVKVIDHQKRTEAELLTRAEIDSISLLYNRGTIQDRISKRLIAAPAESHAFFLLDIDSFKRINDTLGHAIGDGVILSIATVLRKRFRSTDLIGRLGGDEFVALMSYHPENGKSDIDQTALRILNAIGEIVLPGHWDAPLTVSLGISVAPQDGITFEELYQYADKALYSVKARGKNGYALYSNLSPAEKLT
jgi:diguanylate cyclase (GGDEF)-like protein